MTLAGWVDEVNPARKKRLTGKATGVRYAYDFQQHAVIDLCSRQESAQAVTQRIGVSRTTLYNWQKRLLGLEAIATIKQRNDLPLPSERADLEKEVESLDATSGNCSSNTTSLGTRMIC